MGDEPRPDTATPPEEAIVGETATRVSPAATATSPPHCDGLTGEARAEDAADAGERGEADDVLPTAAGEVRELSAKAQKADEYLELAQRTKADFENYRRRAVREASMAQDRGIAKLARELLPAVDNLDRALEAAQAQSEGADSEPDSPLISGIKLVHAEVVAALGRAGIERFEPRGEQFDPTYHEAVAQQPFPGSDPGTIVEVYQRGYRIGESVLRPARVLVAA